MSPWLWVLVLAAAVWAAHWGAERLAHPLKKLRRQWGFTAAAGGAFIGLAAASPEIGINIASAITGVADIGLGAAIGSNILAIPLVITVAYFATRRRMLGAAGEHDDDGREGKAEHRRHLDNHILRVEQRAVTVQALPYLAVIGLFAALTLPSAWRGLQPVDGFILVMAYVVYLTQALLRGRQDGEAVEWSRSEILKALAGLALLAIGAYFTVRATENIVAAIGIAQIVGGLFITGPMAVLPEMFAVWSVSRSGQVTAATTSIIGDHVVTMTLAFLPLALVGLPVQDLQLFAVNLAFVFLIPAAYAAMIHWGRQEHGFSRRQVVALDCVYVTYVGVMFLWVLDVV